MARLVTAIVLSLALAAPAVAQDDQSARISQRGGSSQERVIQQGDRESSVSAHQEDVQAQQDGNCDPNYEGECLDPNARDYDCRGGGGDGPRFVDGPVRVVGDDHFELDTDDPDNIGCEDTGRDGDRGSTPRGGVDSGLGGTAVQAADERRDSSVPTPLAAVLALVGLGTGGVLFVLRRRA